MSNPCEGVQDDFRSEASGIEYASAIASVAKQSGSPASVFEDLRNGQMASIAAPRSPIPFSALLPPGINKNLSSQGRNSGMTRKSKDKMEVPICGRLSADRFRVLETWCDFSFRKRSEVVGMVLERVLEILEQQSTTDMPVEQFVRRLRVEPP